ncbi:hypothetical protein [Hoyosella subflava]|nr:hypothetical protein [Hoyosella subflava]
MISLIVFLLLLVVLDVLALLGRTRDSHLETSPHGSLQYWSESTAGTRAVS